MAQENYSELKCLRCNEGMKVIGTKQFDEGTDWSSWLGDWGKLLNRKEKLDMLGCTNCGKVEFYFQGALTSNDEQ